MTFSVPLHRVVSASEPAFLSRAVAKRHDFHPDDDSSVTTSAALVLLSDWTVKNRKSSDSHEFSVIVKYNLSRVNGVFYL